MLIHSKKDIIAKLVSSFYRVFLFLLSPKYQLLILLLVAEVGFAQNKKNGHVNITIIDKATQKTTPVRVRLTQNNKPVKFLPEAAIGVMYGHWDHADGYAYQPDSSFYINGNFELNLPPGNYHLAISKGNEYLKQQHTLNVVAGKRLKKTYKLNRWINAAERGWYSGDNHIHIRRSPREDPLLLSWIQAEDIHAGVMLQMGDFWATYYAQYAWGEKGVYQKQNYFLTTGQEDPRTPELGHALGLGAPAMVRSRKDYYLYDKVFDRLHELGGLTGYAHQASSFHGYRGLILDGLRKKVDALELLQFCVSDQPLITENYYHLLDLGIPLTAIAGSDFPWCGLDHSAGNASLRAQIGNVRFYTYTGKNFNYQTWKKALKAGHTFVSSGPILEFTVNDSIPGSSLNVTKGALLNITARAYGHPNQVQLSKLEIIGHGKVIGQIIPGTQNQSANQLSINLQIPAESGIWLAARTYGSNQQVAHTTPVYVSVNKGGFHNPDTAPKYLTLSEQYLKELEKQLEEASPNPEFQAWHYKLPLKQRITETREVIELLKVKLK
jgi:hypothetical protein